MGVPNRTTRRDETRSRIPEHTGLPCTRLPLLVVCTIRRFGTTCAAASIRNPPLSLSLFPGPKARRRRRVQYYNTSNRAQHSRVQRPHLTCPPRAPCPLPGLHRTKARPREKRNDCLIVESSSPVSKGRLHCAVHAACWRARGGNGVPRGGYRAHVRISGRGTLTAGHPDRHAAAEHAALEGALGDLRPGARRAAALTARPPAAASAPLRAQQLLCAEGSGYCRNRALGRRRVPREDKGGAPHCRARRESGVGGWEAGVGGGAPSL